jgi:HK97 family phage major capsid protein
MSNSFLVSLREKRESKTSMIESIVERAAEEQRDLTEVELANVEALNVEIKKLDERIEQISDIELRNAKAADLAAKVDAGNKSETRSASPAYVVSEPMTYTERSGNSFLADAYRAQFQNDPDAQERIQRHQREMAIEKRAVSTSNFAGLVVPQYLVDLYAPLARAGRPTADVSRKHQLPAQGMSAVISRITTGTAVAAQTSQNTAAVSTDIDDTTLTVDVFTIAGQQSVSKQALMRGTNIESIVLSDLIRAYHTKLDSLIINGSGSNGQPLGLATMTSGILVTYTATTGTVAGLYPKIADSIQQIQSNVFVSPTHIIMHPRRLGFLLAGVDSSNRPLVVPTAQNPMNAIGVGAGTPAYGANSGYSILGLPIVTDANIATNVGAGTNQDTIFVMDANESHLWEDGTGEPMYVTFEEPNGKVAINIVLFGFAAYSAERYPQAIAQINGTGLAAPSF